LNASDLVSKLVEYYPGKYTAERIDKMRAFSSTIAEDSLGSVYDAITEDRESSGTVGIVDIKKACNSIGVGYRAAQFIPTENWTCECCGYEFRYHPAPNDDDKIDKNIHDVCPMCGFQVGWSKLATQYKARKIKADWLDRLITEYTGAYGPKVPEHKVKKGGLTLDRGGLYWSRSKAENERTDAKKINVQDKLAEIDKAKKIDFAKLQATKIAPPPIPPEKPGELGIF
jgi:hypothetical protein